MILVTGGARSGKSRHAEALIGDSSQVLYIATSQILDDEMAARIEHHRQGRPEHWRTVERWQHLDELIHADINPNEVVLLECVTTMVTNLLCDYGGDKDPDEWDYQAMEQAINAPRGDISQFAPRIHTIKINPDKIKDVIGKGGSVIRALTEETGTTIEIEDDGTVKIAATDGEKAKYAIRRIEEITAEIEVGRIYNGKVTRIVDFGAFVAIGGGKEGLVHISQIADKRVEKVTDYLQMGQEVPVKVLEVDRQGRIRLSIKEATEQSQPAAAPEAPAAEQQGE